MILHLPLKRILICLFIISELAKAAQPATQPANLVNNAAARYWTAFHFLPDDSVAIKVLFSWNKTPLNAEATHVIDAGRISLFFLNQGAALAKCDWEIDYTQGPNTLLPELNKGRALAQLACLRARMEFQRHQPMQAIDDLANCMALAEHLSTDKTYIGTLVRDHIEQIAMENLTQHLQQLDKPALDHLAQRLSNLPAGSTLIEIFQMESRLGAEWIIARAQQAAAIGEPMDWAPLLEDFGSNAQSQVASMTNAAPEDVIAQIQALLPYFASAEQLVQTCNDQHETERALKVLFAQYASKPLAGIFLEDLARNFDTYAAGRTSLTLLQAAIAVMKDGPDRAKNFSDPFNHQPIEYHAAGRGFELVSRVTNRGRAVTLRVTTAPIQ